MIFNVGRNQEQDRGNFFEIILAIIFKHFFFYRSGRFASEPAEGLTSLKCEPPGPGFGVRSDL